MPGPPPEAVRSHLGTVGIEAIPSHPHGEFQTYAQGRVSGAVRGAAAGAAQGLIEALMQGASSSGGGPYAAAATTIAALLLTAAGGVAGGAFGACQAVPAQTASEIQAQLNQVLADLDLPDRLAAEVVRAGQARPDLSGRKLVSVGGAAEGRAGIDSIVAIEVTEAGFQGGRGPQPEVSLYAVAHITVHDATDESLRYQRDFRYDTEPRPFRDWFDKHSRVLADGFQQAVASLADRILDELFIITGFPFASGLWAFPGTPEFCVCWFRPLYPEHRLNPLHAAVLEGMHHPLAGKEEMARNMIPYTPVGSLRPTLRWEPFPRPRDIKPGNKAVRFIARMWKPVSGKEVY
jgi:hypothetical protein